MIPKDVPEPARIAAYLTAHGWHPEWPPGPDGAMFAFEEADDDGQPITVFVPGSSEVTERLYPLAVSALADTVSWVEERAKEAVWADLLATPAETNGTPSPSAPAPATTDAVDPVTP